MFFKRSRHLKLGGENERNVPIDLKKVLGLVK